MTPARTRVSVLEGDCLDVLKTLDAESVQTCVTSPPYFGLRDYGHAGQIGLEPTPDEYVAKLVAVFAEMRRVLRTDATVWLNLGDSYANDFKWGGASGGKHAKGLHGTQSTIGRGRRRTGLPPKSLMLMPARVALALQADGWCVRADIIWHKTTHMPEQVWDRPTRCYEHLFLLAPTSQYYYDYDALAEPVADATRSDNRVATDGRRRQKGYRANESPSNGSTRLGSGDMRNARDLWSFPPSRYASAHFATMSPAIVERCVLAGSRVNDTVLDPFAGAGTTGLVAAQHSRNALLIELNPAYAALARERITADAPLLADVS